MIDGIEVDLGEDELLGNAHGEVATAVEALSGNTAEVADTGDRHRGQTIEELPHAVAAQGDLGADGHTGTQVEGSDGLTSTGHHRLLASDGAQVADSALDCLGIGSGLADTHVHDDLLELRDHHDILVLELVVQSLLDFVLVLGLETRDVLLFSHCSLLHGVLSMGLGHVTHQP